MGRLFILAALSLLAVGIWMMPSKSDLDVSARTTPPEYIISVVQWAKAKSIGWQAAGIAIPDPKPDAMAAVPLYAKACMPCHGGPGVLANAPLKAMRPEPTDLTRDDLHWSEAETFYIIKNGIMGSGMPAYWGIFEDREIWQLAALIRMLPQLSPKSFAALAQSSQQPQTQHQPAKPKPMAKDASFRPTR